VVATWYLGLYYRSAQHQPQNTASLQRHRHAVCHAEKSRAARSWHTVSLLPAAYWWVVVVGRVVVIVVVVLLLSSLLMRLKSATSRWRGAP